MHIAAARGDIASMLSGSRQVAVKLNLDAKAR
jgi:hypothetical protein